MSTSLVLVLVLAALIFAVPVPSWTRAEGVVWLPEETQVRAGAEGFIVEVLAQPDGEVVRGQPLMRAEEPFLAARVNLLQAQREELQVRYDALITVATDGGAITLSVDGRDKGAPGVAGAPWSHTFIPRGSA